MSDENVKREALFNEVKGSLFEFLIGRLIALKSVGELDFINSIDETYLKVLTQQDRMIRQFYPEMLPFLQSVSAIAAEKLLHTIPYKIQSIALKGKLVNTSELREETDLLIKTQGKDFKVSIKLNKRGSYVNTKSGGIKSFFTTYFPFINSEVQRKFNDFVDVEFNRMAIELHQQHDLEFKGNFISWVNSGFSELPGELDHTDRNILKKYYSRISKEIHRILLQAAIDYPSEFSSAFLPLMGFSTPGIIQLICFHDFKSGGEAEIFLHDSKEIGPKLKDLKILAHQDTASVEIKLDTIDLQIRVKPMNKFTTTAIKINCSVKY